MSLSDFACKNAKPKDKPYRLADRDGVYLLVQKKAARNSGNCVIATLRRKNILSFGKYPLVSLSTHKRGGTMPRDC